MRPVMYGRNPPHQTYQSKSRPWVKIPVSHGSVHATRPGQTPNKPGRPGKGKRVPPGGLTRYEHYTR